MGCGATKQKLPRESWTKLEGKRSQKMTDPSSGCLDQSDQLCYSDSCLARRKQFTWHKPHTSRRAFEEVKIGTSFLDIGIWFCDSCKRTTILFSALKEWLWNKTSKYRNLNRFDKQAIKFICSVLITEAFLASRTKDSKPAVDGSRRRLIFDLRSRQSCRQTRQWPKKQMIGTKARSMKDSRLNLIKHF